MLKSTNRVMNSCQKGNSSISSKRDFFRNKLLMSGGFSDYAPFNKFRGDSSASSRFVFKVDDNTSEAEFRIQNDAIRAEFANEFENNYKEKEMLGEGCSSVVKKCEHLPSKEIRAVKIIRSDDDEYI
jgi:hypothetical protein